MVIVSLQIFNKIFFRIFSIMSSSPINTSFHETNYETNEVEGNIYSSVGTRQENDSLTDTLDEPIRDTILRDLKAVGKKFHHVFIPSKSSSNHELLRDWDLWGPMLVF